MPKMTMLDLAKLNGNDLAIGLIEEGLKTCPEIENFPARQVKGTSYTTVRRTGRPSVGFRSPNSGVDANKSTFERDLHEMFVLSGRVEVDKAIADAYEEGPAAMQALEAAGIGAASLETVGRQVWYGKKANKDGFVGLQALCPTNRIVLADTTNAATKLSSVYLVRYGVANGVSFDFGRNSTIDLSDFREETLLDANGRKYPGYIADISGWIGLSLKTTEAIFRIANVGVQSDKQGLSDNIIAKALSLWKGGAPDALYMNRASAYLLQVSRSVTLISGAKDQVSSALGPFAPMPTESNGIPIVITDSLENEETFVS